MKRGREAIAQEAARIICEELVVDYGQAKRKAAARLGAGAQEIPDNVHIQQAVIEYQRLFGGSAYIRQLAKMRGAAERALIWLADFSPRLVGGAVSGAVTSAHRLQLHVFADKAETLDIFLHDHGIPFQQDERKYRYANGREQRVPLARFEMDSLGIDAAVFPEAEVNTPPVNPSDGLAFKRLTLEQARRLTA